MSLELRVLIAYLSYYVNLKKIFIFLSPVAYKKIIDTFFLS